jgi:hypothetical protein
MKKSAQRPHFQNKTKWAADVAQVHEALNSNPIVTKKKVTVYLKFKFTWCPRLVFQRVF